MKPFLKSALAMMLFLFSATGLAQAHLDGYPGIPVPPPPPVEDRPPPHDYGFNNPNVILCMGDSITEGVYVPPQDTYPAKLQAMIGRTVINEGVGGTRTSHGVWTVSTFLNRYRPGYVLILYGANDIGSTIEDQIISNLWYMVQRAKENKTVPILGTLTPVHGSYIGRKSAVLRVNERIREVAVIENIPLADVSEAFGWDGQYMADGLHPNIQGLELIASTFRDAIVAFENPNSVSGKSGGGGGGDGGGGSAAGGGGGCSASPGTGAGGEWALLLAALLGLYLAPRLPSFRKPYDTFE